MKRPFAVFLLSPQPTGCKSDQCVAAVMRKDGSVGLPGGKVDPGESPLDAIIRECGEEGWPITSKRSLLFVARGTVEGREVWWIYGKSKLGRKKPGDNSSPVVSDIDIVLESKYNIPIRRLFTSAFRRVFFSGNTLKANDEMERAILLWR